MPDSRLARPLLALVAVAICLALPAPSRASIPYVPGEVVVRFREGTGEELRRAALGAVGGSQTHAVGTPRVQVVRISGVTIEQAVERLSANPGVVWAEPNYVIQPFVVPNDPRFPEQWPLRNVGQSGGLPDADIRATLAWDLTPGSSSVLVGVIDTGIDYKHPDLAPNIFVNPGEIPDNGIDDDENGFVDDVRGWDFLDRDNDPMDAQGHGTHVAGTIGASGNDSIGVAGVCWRVRLLPLRVLGPAGGTSAGAAEAVRYATMMGARVTNNSWGTSAVSNVLLDAITEARDAGVLFVAAAGNDSRDNAVFPVYPASYGLSNVLSVAATDRRDRLAAFSNYGATTVHIGAPGGGRAEHRARRRLRPVERHVDGVPARHGRAGAAVRPPAGDHRRGSPRAPAGRRHAARLARQPADHRRAPGRVRADRTAGQHRPVRGAGPDRDACRWGGGGAGVDRDR